MQGKDLIVKVIEKLPQTIWSLEEVKNYLRVSHNYDDKLISSLVEAAVSAAENFTNLSITLRHIELTCAYKGRDAISLKYLPVVEITKVTLIDGQRQIEIPSEQYSLELNSAVIYLRDLSSPGKLTIKYLVGITPENLPFPLKHGILLHTAEMYDRQEYSLSVSQQAKSLYTPYRELRI